MMTVKPAVPLAATDTVLNFVVAGEVRAGVSVIQTALDQTPDVVCHGDLLFAEHGTSEEQEAVRRDVHESYFGACRDPKRSPEWFTRESNPYRYLTDQVFDNPRRGERRIGTKLLYPLIERFEMYDLLEDRWREGDFCVVHVLRNPIACLVSAKQAQRSGVWRESASITAPGSPPVPVSLDPTEIAMYVRRSEAVRRKIRASCHDTCEVQYRDLVYRYSQTMGDVFEFLELPQQRVPRPTIRRLRNYDMTKRINNYEALRRELPHDLRRMLEEDLF